MAGYGTSASIMGQSSPTKNFWKRYVSDLDALAQRSLFHALAAASSCLTVQALMRDAVPLLRARAATMAWLSSFSQGFSSVTLALRLKWLASFLERTCAQQTS